MAEGETTESLKFRFITLILLLYWGFTLVLGGFGCRVLNNCLNCKGYDQPKNADSENTSALSLASFLLKPSVSKKFRRANEAVHMILIDIFCIRVKIKPVAILMETCKPTFKSTS